MVQISADVTPLEKETTSELYPGIRHWRTLGAFAIRDQLEELIERSAGHSNQPLAPVLEEFRNTINSNGMLKTLSDEMFVQIPQTPPYCLDPTLQNPQVRTFDHMLELFNSILKEPPRWYDSGRADANGLVGFPMNAILDWPMGTTAGYTFFLQREVNDNLRSILTHWTKYLISEDSARVLNSDADGWFNDRALQQLAATGNKPAGTKFRFDQLYQCPNPSGLSYGFTSWDQFFTREFQWDKRPVARPCDDSIVVHSCESTPWRLRRNVQQWDKFYLKGQPYAIQPMLNNEPESVYFTGGTVYQAFLSALSYHRWHAPVSGTIVKLRNVPGSYFSMNWYDGFANPDGPDPAAAARSQAYTAHVATRGIVFIQADNPRIGLIAVVYIGMAEVSSCKFTVWEGQRVRKGDQLGTFRYGGSTHCIVFRPETKLEFKRGLMREVEKNQMVRSRLATVIDT